MREQVRRIFASLPPEGIAVHGTTLANAKLMEDTGIYLEFSKDGYIHYVVQPPCPNIDVDQFLFRVGERGALDVATTRAMIVTQSDRYYDRGDNTTIPALTVFIPLRLQEKNPPFPYVQTNIKSIPADRIIGTVEIKPFNTSRTRAEIYHKIAVLMKKRGIIGSVESQQPQEVLA